METFHIKMKNIEDEVEDALNLVKSNITRWIEDFKKNCL